MIQRTIPNPFQSLYRALIIAAFLMNIPAVMLMMSGNRTLTMLLGLSQFILFFAGVVFLIHGKKEVRDTLHFLSGEMLVQWTYEQFHWKRFAEWNFHRHRTNARILMLVFLMSGPLAAWLGMNGMSVADGMLLGTILAIVIFSVMTFYAGSIRKKSVRPPFEAFISSEGAFINGVFIDWTAAGTQLLGVSMKHDADSGALVLKLQFSIRSWKGRSIREIQTPVPKDKQNEAATVVSALSVKTVR